jgi:hypothetical protein
MMANMAMYVDALDAGTDKLHLWGHAVFSPSSDALQWQVYVPWNNPPVQTNELIKQAGIAAAAALGVSVNPPGDQIIILGGAV